MAGWDFAHKTVVSEPQVNVFDSSNYVSRFAIDGTGEGMIKAFNRCDKGVQGIAHEIGRSHNIVGSFLRKKCEHGKIKLSGRPSLFLRDKNEQF